MSFSHLRAVTLKEIRHILRDRTTIALVVFTPTALLFVMAYAVTTDINHIPVAVLDMDRSRVSRAFLDRIVVGDDLDLYAQVDSYADLERLLLQGRVKAALIVPPNFERELLALRGMALQVLVDGTEPASGGFAVAHIGRRAREFALHELDRQLAAVGLSAQTLEPLDLRVRIWFNPSLEAAVDMVPGLLSMVIGLPGMTVALTLAREHEHGTMEQLLATPVGRAELLLGKMIPYVLAGIVNVFLMTALARFWFGVPFRGSFVLYLLLSVVFLFAILSMSMVLGVFIRTQPMALAASFLVILFPGFFLTGIFFPIASMPELMRLESMFLPGTHYAVITRAAFLTGVGLDVLWPSALALIVLGVAFTGVAALFFKKKLR
ncbi:MAG: ABC transporter permease [Anaerolineales bacterium]